MQDLLSLACAYLVVASFGVHAIKDIPLCSLCVCDLKPLNINCVSKGIEDIYNKTFWFDQSDTMYPISTLAIQFNNITKLETQFPKSVLQELDLSHNLIKSLGLGVFSLLQNMDSLSLAYNQIDVMRPDVFKGEYAKNEYFPLKSLRKLDLRHNNIHTLDADVFEHIDELNVLKLGNNPFKVIDSQTLTAIASLVRLDVLDFSYAQLAILPDNFLYTPRLLRILDLSGNKFELIPAALSMVHSLKTLDLSKNPIRNFSKANVFPKMSALNVLYLQNMSVLNEIRAKSFSGLVNLTELHLSKSWKLRYIDAEAFVLEGNETESTRLPITKFMVDGCNISYLNRELLAWEKLYQTDLSGNFWACNSENQWMIEEFFPRFGAKLDLWYQNVVCAFPEQLKGMSLQSLHPKSIKNTEDGEISIMTILAAVSGILFVLFAFMLLVYFYRTKTLNFPYIRVTNVY